MFPLETQLKHYSLPHQNIPMLCAGIHTPHHTTPHHTTPHHTTPHHTTPHHTTPHHTTPHHTTPLHTTPHHTTPLHTTLHTNQTMLLNKGWQLKCNFNANLNSAKILLLYQQLPNWGIHFPGGTGGVFQGYGYLKVRISTSCVLLIFPFCTKHGT